MAEKNIVMIGDFAEPTEGRSEGYLSLIFQSQRVSDEVRESSVMSAEFLSKFWSNILIMSGSAPEQEKQRIGDHIRRICTELLENAIKYGCYPEYRIRICLYLHQSELRLYVRNSFESDDSEKFRDIVRQLAEEKNSAGNQYESSGLRMLMNDCGIRLSWKFEDRNPGIETVTTLARLPIVRKQAETKP